MAGASQDSIRADAVVAGGGVIGLAVAWRLAGASLKVAVIDPRPGSGASDVAAGMLAPVTELTYGEESLARLNLASAELYPSFVAELEQASGRDVGYRRSGALTVALDRDDLAVLDQLHQYLERRQLQVERLTATDARRREPLLAPESSGALLAPDDHVIDPRLLVQALREACTRAGVVEVAAEATGVLTDRDRASGLQLSGGGVALAPQVVVAAGAHSAALTADLEPVPVRPVKGQLLVLRTGNGVPLLERTVRGLAHGFAVYLVPRGDGRLVVGATSEERGFDTTVTAEALYTLLRDARRLVPAVDELELVECRAALRPGTPDNGPLLGEGEVRGLLWATGHYRNGVLLTPITADAIAQQVVHGTLPEVAAPFTSARYTRGKVKT